MADILLMSDPLNPKAIMMPHRHFYVQLHWLFADIRNCTADILRLGKQMGVNAFVFSLVCMYLCNKLAHNLALKSEELDQI